jgi:adenylate cyclase
MERRLAAILATDVVGYSRLILQDETSTLHALKAHRDELIEPKIVQHGGRIVKLMGDGLLAEFPSAVGAVLCALEIQHWLGEQSADVPEDRQILYRAGINIGDIVVEDDDIYGDGVNVAARLETLAEPGGICIASNVFDQVKDKLDLTFDHLGDHEVKNISEPVTVYGVRLDDKATKLITPVVKVAAKSASGRWPIIATAVVGCLVILSALAWWQPWGSETVPTSAQAERAPLPDKPSIAVLSFDTFSNEDEQRFLAEGIAEDIITQLARGTALHVMARTSTFVLKDEGLDAREIAKRLGVRYVLEGSVRRIDDKLRITAQLIDASTGDHVWAERYDAGASEIHVTQDHIVEKIVGTLASEIRETNKAAALRRPPDNLDVYELTTRGLARKHRLNPKDMLLAREELIRAVELDPNYAPAWLYLGWVEAIAIVFRWTDDPDFPTLKDAIRKVEKSIELDPMLATAYQALGLLKAYDGDAEGALQAATRSVELGPGDADNLLFLGRALASMGRFDDAISHVRRAMALNPVRPSYYDYYLARSLWGLDDYKGANSASKECLTKAPGFTACRVFQIASYFGMGKASEASKSVSLLLEQTPNFTVADALKSVGFPGDEKANERLEKQLIEAGLPTTR